MGKDNTSREKREGDNTEAETILAREESETGLRSIEDIAVGISVLAAAVVALATYLYIAFTTPWPANTWFLILKISGAIAVTLLYIVVSVLAYRVFIRGLGKSSRSSVTV